VFGCSTDSESRTESPKPVVVDDGAFGTCSDAVTTIKRVQYYVVQSNNLE